MIVHEPSHGSLHKVRIIDMQVLDEPIVSVLLECANGKRSWKDSFWLLFHTAFDEGKTC